MRPCYPESDRVVGVASTNADALLRFEELRPDVTLLDVNLGGESGFEVAGTGGTDLHPRSADFAELIHTSPAVDSCPSRH
ncbi:MAG: response regulator containing a CheY-like receiver domain and an DNA-binding domain [Mycobacterium sp.]|jgi:hypothetical protein|nr:response regulator containing a CheY-like receiver domain and an DNA-binding domain [Mycobacterium sp.]MDT5316132.1 hypothetical protein [Mycobacterium sp.]